MSERETTPDARGAQDGAAPDEQNSDVQSGDVQSGGAEGGAPRDLDASQARLAYQIIGALLEHVRVTGDLVALMAQTIDEDTLKALTATPHWAAYLDSRRAMERTRERVERFAEIMNALGG